jgi:hypothetical protein
MYRYPQAWAYCTNPQGAPGHGDVRISSEVELGVKRVLIGGALSRHK